MIIYIYVPIQIKIHLKYKCNLLEDWNFFYQIYVYSVVQTNFTGIYHFLMCSDLYEGGNFGKVTANNSNNLFLLLCCCHTAQSCGMKQINKLL